MSAASSSRPSAGASPALVVVLALAALPIGEGRSRADTIDPNVPATIVVGAPSGPVAQSRLDGRRTGATRTALPAAPVELWRRTLGTLEVSPLVDETGAVTLALASAEVVKIGSGGKDVWRARMQGGGPASPPIRLSDGTVAVVSTGGVLVGVSPRGKVRFATPLGARGPDLVAPPVALDDGGAALVAGRSLFTFDADGAVSTETQLSAHVSSAPVVTGDGLLVLGDDGSVTRVSPPKQTQKLGAFPGMIDGGAVLADDRTLLGVVRDRLLALDLRTGIVSVRASTGSFATIDGPVTVARDGDVLFTTSEGLLFGLDRTGQEILRATVERVTPPSAPAAYPPSPYPSSPYSPGVFPPGAVPPGSYAPPYYTPPGRQSPPLVVDGAGRIAFLRAAGRFGVTGAPSSGVRSGRRDARDAPAPGSLVDASTASVDVVHERLCNTPLAVLPAGDRRLLVACREGLVVVFADRD